MLRSPHAHVAHTIRPLVFATVFTTAFAACAPDSVTSVPTPLPQASASVNPDAKPLNIYGNGALRRSSPKSPCATGHYRDFDFWAGDWRVNVADGTTVGTSRNILDLDGCVLIENWAPLNGVRGRSLNSYDADAGVWRQTWVPEQRAPASRPLRMAGGLQTGGTMAMTGTRFHWFFGNPFIDSYTWMPIDANTIAQHSVADIALFGVHQEGSLTYVRSTSLPATTSPGTVACYAGGEAGENRNLDFTTGTWTVSASHGPTLGTSVLAVDPNSSGCLIEERFATSKGYRAIAWLYYDPIEDRYFRTYVDSEGQRVEMRGTFENGAIVLEAMEPVPGSNAARVRLTWTQQESGELLQVWSTSRDGGVTWREAQRIEFAHTVTP